MSYKRIPDHGAGQRREQDQNQDEKIQNQLIQRRGRRLWGDQSRQKTQPAHFSDKRNEQRYQLPLLLLCYYNILL